MSKQVAISGFVFKIDDGFNMDTFGRSREDADYNAKRYYENNPNWYQRGKVVPVQVIQQAEYV